MDTVIVENQRKMENGFRQVLRNLFPSASSIRFHGYLTIRVADNHPLSVCFNDDEDFGETPSPPTRFDTGAFLRSSAATMAPPPPPAPPGAISSQFPPQEVRQPPDSTMRRFSRRKASQPVRLSSMLPDLPGNPPRSPETTHNDINGSNSAPTIEFPSSDHSAEFEEASVLDLSHPKSAVCSTTSTTAPRMSPSSSSSVQSEQASSSANWQKLWTMMELIRNINTDKQPILGPTTRTPTSMWMSPPPLSVFQNPFDDPFPLNWNSSSEEPLNLSGATGTNAKKRKRFKKEFKPSAVNFDNNYRSTATTNKIKKYTPKIHRSFTCNQCKDRFSTLYGLSTHTTEVHKMYRCTICHAEFTQRSNLQRHSLKHVGFKPFQCRLCDKAYYRKDHLMRHLDMSHPGENPATSIHVMLTYSECLDYLDTMEEHNKVVGLSSPPVQEEKGTSPPAATEIGQQPTLSTCQTVATKDSNVKSEPEIPSSCCLMNNNKSESLPIIEDNGNFILSSLLASPTNSDFICGTNPNSVFPAFDSTINQQSSDKFDDSEDEIISVV